MFVLDIKSITIKNLTIKPRESHMDIVKNILRWIFILFFPLFLLTASLAISFNSHWIFNYGFDKYDVSKTTGLSEQNLDKIAASWTSYINSSKEYWDITINQNGSSFTLFTSEEQMHFKDVKALVLLDYLVFSLTLVLCIGYGYYSLQTRTKKSYKRLAKDIILGSTFSIGLILGLGVASFFNFNALFLNMHYLFFNNDYWYAEGYMLELFPGGFWYDAAFIAIGLMTSLIFINMIVAFIILRLNKVNSGKNPDT